MATINCSIKCVKGITLRTPLPMMTASGLCESRPAFSCWNPAAAAPDAYAQVATLRAAPASPGGTQLAVQLQARRSLLHNSSHVLHRAVHEVSDPGRRDCAQSGFCLWITEQHQNIHAVENLTIFCMVLSVAVHPD